MEAERRHTARGGDQSAVGQRFIFTLWTVTCSRKAFAWFATPMTVRHDGAEGRPRWSPRSSLAARGMREGPSEPTGRGRLQTTVSCPGKESGW
jgi:hypothetical protein